MYLGSCPPPDTPTYAYPLTTSQTSYATNATYDIYCKPSYTTTGGNTLTCLSTGSWDIEPPTCIPAGNL